MYKLGFVKALLFDSSPDYQNRDFSTARFESFMYYVLRNIVNESRKIVDYSTDRKTHGELIENFGLMWLIADHIQDENQVISDSELEDIILLNSSPDSKSLLVNKLVSSATFLKNNISSSHLEPYRESTKQILENQKTTATDLEDLQKASAKKGGYFVLSVIKLLGPSNLDKNKELAAITAGSWFQAIDDYADAEQDRKLGIKTIFTESNNPDKVLIKLTENYRESIETNLGREDVFIQLLEDLQKFMFQSQFFLPKWFFNKIV